MTTWKEWFIETYGEVAYKRDLQHKREWEERNHDKVKAKQREICRKGGKYYEHNYKYQTTGLQGERGKIRTKHGHQYRQFKHIIAPLSQIHHEWIPGTADFRGVALVEKNPHQYGIINVIQILEGEITLLTEKEITEFKHAF